jgi:hypothetical protein
MKTRELFWPFAIPDDGPLPEELVEQGDLQRRLHAAISMPGGG